MDEEDGMSGVATCFDLVDLVDWALGTRAIELAGKTGVSDTGVDTAGKELVGKVHIISEKDIEAKGISHNAIEEELKVIGKETHEIFGEPVTDKVEDFPFSAVISASCTGSFSSNAGISHGTAVTFEHRAKISLIL